MRVARLQAPFSDSFLSEFASATKSIFGAEAEQTWLNALKWRLQNMPDVTIFVAEADAKLVGYKAGYAIAYDRYYSWLGGVAAEFRRQGLARELMIAQHEWLSGSRFQLVETHVEQQNTAMMQLNLKHGFVATGSFLKSGAPYSILQKALNVRR